MNKYVYTNIFFNLLAETQKCDLIITFIDLNIKIQSLQTKSIIKYHNSLGVVYLYQILKSINKHSCYFQGHKLKSRYIESNTGKSAREVFDFISHFYQLFLVSCLFVNFMQTMRVISPSCQSKN